MQPVLHFAINKWQGKTTNALPRSSDCRGFENDSRRNIHFSEIATMKKDNDTGILEFEVIAPTNDLEQIGEKLTLSKFGEYCPDNSLRGYNLLFLLDHTLHYRVSKIMMKGKAYEIPADRKKNYVTDMHPHSLKFRIAPKRYETTGDYKEPLVDCDDGEWISFKAVQHLF